jgi:hypothetical protein
MAANSSFRITELEPSAIKENLKNFLRNQSEFTDYDFEGSGMNILLDLLAYNTHYMAFYQNMIGAESFLDSAQLRNSIISHSKHLGYTPNSMKPAKVYATIQVTPSTNENQVATTLTLPRWTKFLSQSLDGTNYQFLTINSNNAVKVNNTFTFSNVVMKQGEVVTRAYLVDNGNPDRSYYIPSANVDTDEIYVSVQKSATNTYTESYMKFDDLTTLRGNSRVFFVEESSTGNNNYRIFFGDNVLGKKPENGEIVTVTYLVSEGKYANEANSFIIVESIGGYDDNVRVIPMQAAGGGADRETIEQVRFRAPRYYSTQNRAVTSKDYETLITQDYPNIDSVSVWGGEEEVPPVYGKVYISLKPKVNYYITNFEKDQIITNIIKTRSILSVIPEIVEPDYTWLLLSAKVYYDKGITNMDDTQVSTLVRQTILDYRDGNLQKFESKFRISKLQRTIENVHESFNAATIEMKLQKRLYPDLNKLKNYTINFNKELEKDKLYTFPSFQHLDSNGVERDCYIEEVPQSYTGIDKIDIVSRGNDYEDVTVTITGDGTGATATAKIVNKKISSIDIVERGSNYSKAVVTITSNTGYGASASADLQFNNGVLRMYYYKPNGEKVFINPKIGTINYLKGIIVLDNLKVKSVTQSSLYNDDLITFNIEPKDKDISPIRNAILDLDENDDSSIKITPIAE